MSRQCRQEIDVANACCRCVFLCLFSKRCERRSRCCVPALCSVLTGVSVAAQAMDSASTCGHCGYRRIVGAWHSVGMARRQVRLRRSATRFYGGGASLDRVFFLVAASRRFAPLARALRSTRTPLGSRRIPRALRVRACACSLLHLSADSPSGVRLVATGMLNRDSVWGEFGPTSGPRLPRPRPEGPRPNSSDGVDISKLVTAALGRRQGALWRRHVVRAVGPA